MQRIRKSQKKYVCAMLTFFAMSCSESTPIANLASSDEGVSSNSQELSSSSQMSVELGEVPAMDMLEWNGAKGAYSIIMDDFCLGTTTSLQWAASEANSRGLPIAFAVVAGNCDESDWETAKAMVENGNEAVNHSWSHTNSETWTAEDLEKELLASTETIGLQTGVRPTFFGYPFDFATTASQSYLQGIGYLGSRSYNKRSYANGDFNTLALKNGFTVEYDARHPASGAQYQHYGMDEYVDVAVQKGTWALRETHGVDDGSYGEWAVDEFSAHLDYLAKLQEEGKLWVATPSHVIRHIFLKRLLTWDVNETSSSFEITWTSSSADLEKYGTDIVFAIDREWSAMQNGSELPCRYQDGRTLISVNPSLGPVQIVPLQ